jgi:hypothetical protein
MRHEKKIKGSGIYFSTDTPWRNRTQHQHSIQIEENIYSSFHPKKNEIILCRARLKIFVANLLFFWFNYLSDFDVKDVNLQYLVIKEYLLQEWGKRNERGCT